MNFFNFYTKLAINAFIEGISKTTGTLLVVAIGYKLYFKRQLLDIDQTQPKPMFSRTHTRQDEIKNLF